MNYKTNPWTLVFTIIFTAVIVSGVIFLWQNKEEEKTTRTTSTQLSSGDPVDISEIKEECPQNWTRYESENFSFCYNNLWGKPTYTDETHLNGTGKLFKIAFANEEYHSFDNAPSTPQLWWETKDFSPYVADYMTTCYKCINFDQSEPEIIFAIGYEEKNATIQKLILDNKKALRIETDYIEEMFEQGKINRLTYLIPNAFTDYHFKAVVSFRKFEELDTLMKTLTFNN